MVCGVKIIKYLLFGFNVLFWVTGAIILAIGIWTKVEPGYYDPFLGDKGYKTSANLMLISGAVVMVVGFLGCCGAARESRCMLGWFFAFLLLIFLAEITAGILAFVFKDEVKKEIRKEMKQMMNIYYGGVHYDVTFDVDQLQSKLECCGLDNYKDWNTSNWYKVNIDKEVPSSCCKSKRDIMPLCNLRKTFDVTNIYTAGCVNELDDFVQKHLLVVGAIGVAISCIQLLGMMFACALFCSIDD